MPPDRIQRHDLIMQFREGEVQERIDSMRFEVYAEKLDISRPHPPAFCTGCIGFCVIGLMHLEGMAKVSHQV
jgi:hypothetical protein